MSSCFILEMGSAKIFSGLFNVIAKMDFPSNSKLRMVAQTMTNALSTFIIAIRWLLAKIPTVLMIVFATKVLVVMVTIAKISMNV